MLYQLSYQIYTHKSSGLLFGSAKIAENLLSANFFKGYFRGGGVFCNGGTRGQRLFLQFGKNVGLWMIFKVKG
ncbi:MAG TPA: hypothetical protein VL547_14665 [Dinghuibacter sp.]|uniref:hypothetical protein n=1 Tax=Dinghuibacter sp. TaxID=2024697 RepID=UPI002C39B666|nr:hypothetical protein [Dinghuibacter sp.]HTJ13274.1 hypothetical protein [Dinghuibacter sp.]